MNGNETDQPLPASFAEVIAEVIRRFIEQGEERVDMVGDLRAAADELELDDGDDEDGAAA